MPNLARPHRSGVSESTQWAEKQCAKSSARLDVCTVAGLWVIGVLIMLHLMIRFPGLGALIESYNRF